MPDERKVAKRSRIDGLEVRGMEEVQEQTQEVFESDMRMYLTMFCEEQGIEDMRTASQSVWNAALMYIKRHVFSDSSILKLSKPLDGYINNSYTADNNIYKLNNSNCNAYDINKVDDICNYYIYLCYMYEKEISIMGFSKLTGINQDTIHDWGKDSNKLSTAGCEIYKKLTAEREESLVAKLVNLKHPTAIAILLNKHFGYNLPGVGESKSSKRVLTAAELPKLGSGEVKGINVVTDRE